MTQTNIFSISVFCRNLIITSFLLFILTHSPFIFANKLDSLQSQIQRKELQITEQNQQRKILEEKLRQQEKDIKIFTGSLINTQKQTKISQQKISQSELRIQKLIEREKEQNNQLNQLAKQIYNMEKTSFVKQVLSEQDFKTIRIKQFLRKLYRTKNETIKKLQATKQQLKQEQLTIKTQLNEKQNKLKLQEQQQRELELKKQEYLVTLNKLKSQLEYEKKQLAKLRKNETELRYKIEQANKQDKEHRIREKNNIATKGLGKPRKQFQKPVNGEIIHSFGSIQMGELRWKGIVIKAPKGSSVKAIADGRVILAGQLQGYGLMVIIKHGEKDLSLYGYNESIKVKQGDIVLAGQKIASVGYAQGKPYSGTYFEISQKGNPINPIGWLK